MPRYLDPKTDIVFKKIFGQRPKLLISFLNALLPLPPDGEIRALEYLPTEQAPTVPEFKRSIVDVKCTDQQGRIFIVEMQVQWVPHFMQRMLFGAGQAYVRQLQKGEPYEFLNPVYGLGLIGDVFDRESADWYHHYKIINVDKPEREMPGLQFVYVELPKFRPSRPSEKKLQVLWLRFMSEIGQEGKAADAELLAVPEIKEAVDIAEESGFTREELAAYDEYWDAVSTEKTMARGYYQYGLETGIKQGVKKGIKQGIKQGIEQGRQEGEQQAKLAMAKQMLAAGMPLAEVCRFTQLPPEAVSKPF